MMQHFKRHIVHFAADIVFIGPDGSVSFQKPSVMIPKSFDRALHAITDPPLDAVGSLETLKRKMNLRGCKLMMKEGMPQFSPETAENPGQILGWQSA